MSTTQEIWVDIKNYEGCYQISIVIKIAEGQGFAPVFA